MPKICVEIELDTDTNQVRVGVEPYEGAAPAAGPGAGPAAAPAAGAPPAQGAAPIPGAEGAEDKSYLQPANSIDEALQTAKSLLTNPQAQAAEAAPVAGGGEQEAAEKSFAALRGG